MRGDSASSSRAELAGGGALSRLADPTGSGSPSPRFGAPAAIHNQQQQLAAAAVSLSLPLPPQPAATSSVSQQQQGRAPPLGAASAALYASAIPYSRVSPIAHPAKHGMNPRVGGAYAGGGASQPASMAAWANGSNGNGTAAGVVAGANGSEAAAGATAAAAAGRSKQLPAVPFLPVAATSHSATTTPTKGQPSPRPSSTAGTPTSASRASPHGDGLRCLLGADGAAAANGPMVAARRGLIGTP